MYVLLKGCACDAMQVLALRWSMKSGAAGSSFGAHSRNVRQFLLILNSSSEFLLPAKVYKPFGLDALLKGNL
jgi:hypothetical protein